MKQIFAPNYAVVQSDLEIFTLNHPTTIFMDDDVVVEIADTEEGLATFVASMQVGKFPAIPEIGEWCEGNKFYAYGDDKAKCLKGHYRTHYAIEETPALWLVIPTISAGYPVWVQPTGAHDAYNIGDRVHFPTINDAVYESKINANVWSPIVYPQGWLLIG